MRCNDQPIELVVGIVGEREHHPILSTFAGADFDSTDDTVSARRRGNLDAVGIAALVIEHGGKIDCRRVTADADRVDRPRGLRGDKHHEAQREGRKAPDQTQMSVLRDRQTLRAKRAAQRGRINDMKAKQLKEFPARFTS
jgi:hypothetical protein